jgi:uncharacterized protein YfaS (alpha-2-macroglobulin family)
MSRWAVFWLAVLVLLSPTLVHSAQPGPSTNSAKRKAMKPNLDLYVYRRCYAPGEKVQMRLSGFNVPSVQLAAYRLDLGSVVRTSRAMEKLGKSLTALNLEGQSPIAAWRYSMGKVYRDQWAERAVNVPNLPPGAYLIRASAGGVEKRTWLAVTRIALLAKRSRQELLVYATEAASGRPVGGLALSLADAHGARRGGRTGADGVLRVPTSGAAGNVWIHGTAEGSPAFALTGEPAAADPYTVYTVTDRPIYRPGHMVQYKATVRRRVEAVAPGGFVYRPYAGPAVVEIRDATDALVARRPVTTSAAGSLSGEFQLAAEPALGNWHLNVVLGEYHAYGGFLVEAYRKPEMQVSVRFDRAHYPGGAAVPATVAAQYYFGQPVARAGVQYQIRFAGDPAEPPYEGQGVTDAKGQLHLEIKTQRLASDRTLFVHATVTDLSRRRQSGDGSALITAGLFRLSVETEKEVYRPGERIAALVHATDYDGKPVAARVRVRLIETKEDRQHRPYAETATRDIMTDATGSGTAYFSSPRPGNLRLTAEAFDSEQNKIAAEGSVWVAGEEESGYDYPTLELVSSQHSCRPGETATVLLNTSLVRRPFVAATKTNPPRPPHPDAWALVTIEGERLGRSEVVHLTRKTTLLRVPLTANDFPSISVNVAVIQDRQLYEQELRLPVLRDEQKLRVAVASDREKYQPGETASYTVTTRDYRGRPVPAEVSLGVVDASIYAIQPDNAPNMESFFYGGQEVRVQTSFSFAAQYSGGGYQTVPASPAAGGPGGIRVRRQFADTAYWNPVVQTGPDGTARVSFTVPDNLTTWRATARGITAQTAVGSATQEAIASMPLLVRLELPRFYVQGDQALVSAIVHNYTGTQRAVQAHVEAHGAALTGDAARTVQLPPGGEQRLDWQAKITDLSGARFLVVADGGPGGQDATELSLPVQPAGLRMVTATAETFVDPAAQDRINLAELPPGATVTLTLSPSVASVTQDALSFLTSYPYGCAEQTMSALLADIAVARALRHLHVNRPVRPDPKQYVSLGLQKLYRYQHQDGGWNWWEFDQTDGDMTAYLLYGLLQAKEAGFLVDDQRILRGTEALRRLLGQERDLSRRADWLLSLAYARPVAAEKPLAELYQQRGRLDSYGQASLCLALARLGGPGPAGEARTLAQELAARATVRGRTDFWPAAEGGYSWRSDDVSVTAHVLRALLTVSPRDPTIPGALRWLMANRDGSAWGSTKASAEAVFALAQAMEQSRQSPPDFTARVALDGQTVHTLTAASQNLFDPPVIVSLKPEQLKGHSMLTVDKQGPGALYLSRVVSYVIPPGQATPQSRGLTVRRSFRVSADDPSRADTIASGSEMEVQVEITADTDYRYVMLEDPIPAGCEVEPQSTDDGRFPLEYSEGSAGYTRQETRDNRVVFFFDSLPKGRTRLTYRLRAETPGQYRILPGIASLTYFPEVRGNSGLATARIGERP